MRAAERFYIEHEWSGCAGSAWGTLTSATREGWEVAARLAAQLETVTALAADWEQMDSADRPPPIRMRLRTAAHHLRAALNRPSSSGSPVSPGPASAGPGQRSAGQAAGELTAGHEARETELHRIAQVIVDAQCKPYAAAEALLARGFQYPPRCD